MVSCGGNFHDTDSFAVSGIPQRAGERLGVE